MRQEESLWGRGVGGVSLSVLGKGGQRRGKLAGGTSHSAGPFLVQWPKKCQRSEDQEL